MAVREQTSSPPSDSKIERRLRQARVQAQKREQEEVAIFKRVHVPESTLITTFRQAVLVYSRLSAWAKQYGRAHESCQLTPEEVAELHTFSVKDSVESTYKKLKRMNAHSPETVLYKAVKKYPYQYQADQTCFLVLKRVDVNRPRMAEMAVDQRLSILDESRVLKNCSHQNIISYYDTIWKEESDYLWICWSTWIFDP